MSKLHFLKNPWVVLLSIALGAAIGLLNQDLALFITPFSDVYLSFLKMCVLPIMVTAVVSSIGKLLHAKESGIFLKRIVVVFCIGLLATSLVGLVVGLTGKPGDGLGKEKQATLGKLLVETEKRSDRTVGADSFNMKSFVTMLIPTNIFDALYNEKNLQVLFFSIVFGIGVGLIRSPASVHILSAGETIFKAFEKAISWSLYALPFGLMSIMAGQIAQTGATVMFAMAKFIMLTYVASFILLAISSLAIWYTTGKSVVKSLADLKEPLLIALGTRSSYAAMPSLFKTMREDFSLDPQAIHLIVPLNIVICRYSMVLVYTLGTVFAAQLYGVPFGFFSFMLALFGAVIAALAGAGSPAAAALSMISIVLGMFGLPSGTAIILILAIITMIDPILTVINVHLACSSTLFIVKPASTPKDSSHMGAVGTTV